MNSKINLLLGVMLIILFGVGIYLAVKVNNSKNLETQNLESNDYSNANILELTAKAGYQPAQLQGEANRETILRIKTTNSFDCSTALVIPKLKIQKNLPPTGITEIKIPPQKPGTKIAGTCSMGMYHFSMNFN